MLNNFEQSMNEHGGNIYRLAEELNMPESKVIDFSASVNPLGVSGKVKAGIKKELQNLHNYPDPDAKKLREKIAQYHHIEPETLLCGNGSTELIYLVPKALKPRNVVIMAPTFSEYERAIYSSKSFNVVQSSSRLNNIEPLNNVELKSLSTILYLPLKEEDNFRIRADVFIQDMQGCNMAFLCNPNNPTGRLLKKEEVKKIADAAKELKCYLVVDEAFIDFHPEESVIKDVQNNPYLIVLRSMTKFYALSGLRVGYGVFPRHIVNMLKEHKEPWTVNTLAQKAAIAALADNNHAVKTFKVIRKEKRFLENGFRELGIKFYPSDTNFYLLKINNSFLIVPILNRKGILVRNCSNFKGLDNSYIRVAVKSRPQNRALVEALRYALNK